MPEMPRSISGQETAVDAAGQSVPSEGLPHRKPATRRASWARGLSLTPTEYNRVAAFQRTAINADRARVAVSDPTTAKRRMRATKERPFPLDEDQVRRMEDMALDLYRELREDDRLKTAADRALVPLRRARQQRAEEQAEQQRQEREGLKQLWDVA